jgi:hypothetical protein
MRIIEGDIIVRYMQEEKKETLWQLKKSVIVENNIGETVIIPEGFETDFASVPKIFWSLISTVGHYNLAALVHDYYYTYKIKPRAFADKQFLTWMTFVSPKTKFRNILMYIMVRLFGKKRFKMNFLN